MNAAALVVSRQRSDRAMYFAWLREEGYRVVEADSTSAAIERHARTSLPITIAEPASPVIDGVELIEGIRAVDSDAAILIVAGLDSLRGGVAALKAGATDLLVKPLERDVLAASLRRMLGDRAAVACDDRPSGRRDHSHDFADILTRSPSMRRTLALARRVAPRDTTVLITGESGTGKELLARAIHRNSARAGRPLIAINCAAIPEGLLESELFGYRRGAFTGAASDKPGLVTRADGGTLFLDEVGELPLSLQPKLLRFLQDGTYFTLGSTQLLTASTRVIAAANIPLEELVAAGSFRCDLYYRLSTFPIHLPSLADRPEDIPLLVHEFVSTLSAGVRKPVPGISREAVSYLVSQPWPGNVRELRNAVERAVIVSDGNLLTSADFRVLERDIRPRRNGAGDPWTLPEHGVDLHALNRALVAAALLRKGGNVSAAARLLGLSRPALRYRMRKYRLGAQPPHDARAQPMPPCQAAPGARQ